MNAETAREAALPDADRPLTVGSESAADLASLFRLEYPRLVRLAHLLTGSNAVAEEIVQDAFEALQRRWRSVEAPAGYVHRSVVNGCRAYHRRQTVERRHPPAAPSDVHPPEIDEMWRLIQGLAPRPRAVLVLRFYEDRAVDDIAEVLGMRPGTVKSLLHRALRTLREELS